MICTLFMLTTSVCYYCVLCDILLSWKSQSYSRSKLQPSLVFAVIGECVCVAD